jgi:hypothetical protein
MRNAIADGLSDKAMRMAKRLEFEENLNKNRHESAECFDID